MQPAPWYYNLVSLAGLAVLCLLAWLPGKRRRQVKWRPVAGGIALQLIMRFFVFWFPPGRSVLLWLNQMVLAVIKAGGAGASFLFGPLALGPGQSGPLGEKSLGFILGLQALPLVIFFMALAALLYQAGIMQAVVRIFSRIFVRTLGTSGAESLGAASTIFVGVETAGIVRPFLEGFTRSEFFTLLTACMATVASSTLAVYVAAIKPHFPQIAGHLVSASLISAPAAVVVAKLMEPERQEPFTGGRLVDPALGCQEGYLAAVIQGSQDGVKLVVGIAALLISFLGIVALADALVGWAGSWFGAPGLSLAGIMAYPALPLTIIMGVPQGDAMAVARLIGERVFVTEIPAYIHLAGLLQEGKLIFARSPLLASYALCGFAHMGSVAIFVGGFSVLVPGRRGEISRMGLKALWAATLATIMTGCVAGVFAGGGKTILGLE